MRRKLQKGKSWTRFFCFLFQSGELNKEKKVKEFLSSIWLTGGVTKLLDTSACHPDRKWCISFDFFFHLFSLFLLYSFIDCHLVWWVVRVDDRHHHLFLPRFSLLFLFLWIDDDRKSVVYVRIGIRPSDQFGPSQGGNKRTRSHPAQTIESW